MTSARAATPTLALALALGATPARAQPREPVAIHYRATSGCPDRAALERALTAAAPSVRIDVAARRVLAIDVGPVDAGFRGRLTVASEGGVARELTAASCDELIAALALVIELGAVELAAARAPAPRAVPPPRAWRYAAVAAGGVVSGVSPGPMWLASAEASATRHGSLRLAAALGLGHDRAAMAEGAASFRLVTGRASACLERAAGFTAAFACAELEAGVLEAAGVGIVNARSLDRPWLATGATFGGRVALTGALFGELRTGLAVPWHRDFYYFDPAEMIHATSVVRPSVSIAVGVHAH